jgi:hypothetical protein
MASGDYVAGNNYTMNALNSTSQPPAYFWGYYGNVNHNGGPMGLNAGDYNLRYGWDALWNQSTTGRVVGTSDIDALWVPPNMNVGADGCDGQGCNMNQLYVNYSGTSSSTGNRGQYWPVPGPMGIGRIGTLNIRQTDDVDETDPMKQKRVPYPWKRVLQKCCTGNLNKCGSDYDGHDGIGCGAQFATCKGSDLIPEDDALLPYQGQYCTASCKSNYQGCDVLKKSYCNQNPDSSWCTCMNLDKNPDYKAWLQAFTKKYPSIPASKLMYRDSEGNNPCRDNLGGDLNDIFIPYELTLSIGNLPDSYSILELNVTGSNNTLSDINMAQISGTSAANPTAAIEATQEVVKSAIEESSQNNAITYHIEAAPSETSYLLLFIIFVVIICIIGAAIWFFNRRKSTTDKNDKNDKNTEDSDDDE